jgi:Putative peptidoglycan binding domain
MATGQDLIDLAASHVGEEYILGANAPKDNPEWTGPWDCAEFTSWVVFQASGRLYGCTRDDDPPASADAYTGAWQHDAQRLGNIISLERAIRTPGAAVLRYPKPGAHGHIVFSDGAGGTVEAKGHAFGVVRDRVDDERHFDVGVLVPWIDYVEGTAAVTVKQPTNLLMLGDAGDEVRALQTALAAAGVSPGVIDGVFGPHTQAAVVAFQLRRGLVPDGEVGPRTREALAKRA